MPCASKSVQTQGLHLCDCSRKKSSGLKNGALGHRKVCVKMVLTTSSLAGCLHREEAISVCPASADAFLVLLMLLPQPPPFPRPCHPAGQAAACSTQFHSRGGCRAAAGDTEHVAGVTVAEICLLWSCCPFFFCSPAGWSGRAQLLKMR